MSQFIDFYKVLGVSRNATEKDIRSAWKRMAREWHPDLVTDTAKKTEYGEKCTLINQAADTLLKDRARYDAKLRYSEQAGERARADQAAREAAEQAREAEATRAEEARQAERARADQERREAQAARADQERRDEAERAARAQREEAERVAAARRKRFRNRLLRVAIAAWAVVYLALTPTLVTTNLPFGWSNSAGRTLFMVAAVFALAVALPFLGAATKVFEFEVPSKRFGMAVGIVAGQGLTVFVLLVLAPLVAFLWAVLKVVLLLLGLLFVLSILLS